MVQIAEKCKGSVSYEADLQRCNVKQGRKENKQGKPVIKTRVILQVLLFSTVNVFTSVEKRNMVRLIE